MDLLEKIVDYFGISIHSLVKRETPFCHDSPSPKTHFNPLPRKEGDKLARTAKNLTQTISIHSLVKRETLAFHYFHR